MTTQPRLSPVPPHWHRPPEPPRSAATVTRILTRPTVPSGEVPAAGVQGALALDLAPTLGSPAVPELSLVTDAATAEDEQAAAVQLWAARFAQAVVEVTGGDRPVTQMLRWTSSRVYQDLERRVRVLAQTRSPGPRRRVLRPQVRSVHVCLPTARSAEVSVHVRYGQRSRALAARLELRGGTWTCTALQLG